jgi:hypothetical protein
MKRLAIALAGLSTAVASGIAAVFLAYLAEDEARAWLLWVLTVASVAGPLYGAVAGVQNGRWRPLLVGVTLAVPALAVLFALASTG